MLTLEIKTLEMLKADRERRKKYNKSYDRNRKIMLIHLIDCIEEIENVHLGK